MLKELLGPTCQAMHRVGPRFLEGGPEAPPLSYRFGRGGGGGGPGDLVFSTSLSEPGLSLPFTDLQIQVSTETRQGIQTLQKKSHGPGAAIKHTGLLYTWGSGESRCVAGGRRRPGAP
jgi:hypothetical protein